MARSIGLAFQGGGAKVISLIAAAEAISELVANGDLKVDAVSGTSAGSLAALLLSARVDFTKIKSAIRKQESIINGSFPKYGKIAAFCKMASYMITGSPIYRVRDFNIVLEGILRESGLDINKSIEEIAQIPLHVIVSNVYAGRSEPIEAGALRDVLRRSCALPVVFSSYKSEDQGQYVDGGVFDNLPTDVLITKLGPEVPVFAIGFEPENVETPNTSFEYITALVGSVVTHNVSRSRKVIGSDFVCPLGTSLRTLDFDKMVSVGLNQEYDAIKAATASFFRNWLAGKSSSSFDTVGQRAILKLKSVEQNLLKYVESAYRSVRGHHEYVKMRVTANCLEHPNRADDIHVEQLLVIPAGFSLPGTIIPLVNGAGSPEGIQCVVRADGPDGDDIPFTEFFVDDEMDVGGVKVRRNSVVILFANSVAALIERKLYIAKKETRFGFMAPLRSGSDTLAISASYWKADMLAIELTVPPVIKNLQSDWASKGSGHPCAPVEAQSRWLSTSATLAHVEHKGQLKGLFTWLDAKSQATQ